MAHGFIELDKPLRHDKAVIHEGVLNTEVDKLNNLTRFTQVSERNTDTGDIF